MLLNLNLHGGGSCCLFVFNVRGPQITTEAL